jgi:para-nitrobenzyl esterase
MLTKLLVTAALATGLATAPSVADQADDTVRTVEGSVRGTVAADHRTFQGLPFAAPPVGELRWRSPQPVTPWTGIREATTPGPRCPQSANGGTPSVAEDCLYLNVTTPRTPGRKPVMVWVHGGGNTIGGAADFDATRLAVQGDVIVVTTNYRLGVLSSFAHQDLAGGGSFGLEDQQAALRWVRRNATAFGGDPNRVTLFGESGGAFDVCGQLTSPASRGLFQRAIIQSGTCASTWPANGIINGQPAASPWVSLAEARSLGADLAAKYGCADVECLRRVPVSELVPQDGVVDITRLTYGTRVLPTNPADAVARGAFHRVPVIAGHTRDEGRLSAAFAPQPFTEDVYQSLLAEEFGADAPRVAAEYPSSAYSSPSVAYGTLLTDRVWACAHVTDDRAMARHTKVYGYEFADRTAPPGWFAFPADLPPGAFHSSELAYLFDVAGFPATLNPSQKALADQLIAYWSRFATTGNPNGGDLPRWPVTRGSNSQSLAPGAIAQVDVAAEHNCGFWR